MAHPRPFHLEKQNVCDCHIRNHSPPTSRNATSHISRLVISAITATFSAAANCALSARYDFSNRTPAHQWFPGKVESIIRRDALIADYSANRRKWLRKGKEGKPYICNLSHLDRFFTGRRAVDISTDDIRKYIRGRQEGEAANGAINRSLALLRRMFRLSVQDGKLRDIPHFPMLKEASPRKGFLEYSHFQRLREELPEYLRTVVTMAYYTGMRLGEILNLRWWNINFLEAEARLDPGATKNDEPRTIPLAGELLRMLEIERQKNPNSECVFTHDGKPIKIFRKAWTSACKRAGLSGLLFHDLRRTGLRNLVRAGVPERVAMAISGHKTRSVFERYNIVSGRDLKDAAHRLEEYLNTLNGANSGQSTLRDGKTENSLRVLTN